MLCFCAYEWLSLLQLLAYVKINKNPGIQIQKMYI